MRTYWKPLVEWRGSNADAVAGGDHHVGLEREGDARGRGERAVRDVGLGDVAVGVEPLAVGDRELGALGPEVVEADPAVAVLPEVDDVAAGPELGHRHGGELLDAPDRRAERRARASSNAVVGDAHGVPARAVGAGLGPAGDAATEVVDLAADQVGSQDVAGRRPPRRVGAQHDGLARRERDVQLGQERGGGAVGVDGADDAVLAPPPAVAQQGADAR